MKETLLSVINIALAALFSALFLPFLCFAIDSPVYSNNKESRRIEITQVSANFIELTNFSDSFDDVSNLWLHDGISSERIGDHQISCGQFTLIAGSKIVVETAFLLNMKKGELALYNSDKFRASDLVDYLNWGLSNFSSRHLEAAISIGIWQRRQSLKPITDNYSLHRRSDNSTSPEWALSAPNFCIDNDIDCSLLEGGQLNGPSVELCIGRGIERKIPLEGWTINGYSGPKTHWILTDENNIVKLLTEDLFSFNFDQEDSGTLLTYHISYLQNLEGIIVGQKLELTQGCFDISNPIRIFLNEVSPQSVISDPVYFCVDDGQRDNLILDDLQLEIPANQHIKWYVTNRHNVVIASPEEIELLNFEGSGEGQLFVWGLIGDQFSIKPIPPADVLASGSCQNMIGPIVIYRLLNAACSSTCNEEAGQLSFQSGELLKTYCTTDKIPDILETKIENNSGFSQLVLADPNGKILALEQNDVIDFEGTGVGEARVFNLAFNPKLIALSVGQNIYELNACISISNSIIVYRETCKVDCLPPENFRVHKSPNADIKLSWKPSIHARKYHVSFGPLSNPDISIVISTKNTDAFVTEMIGGTFISKVRVECGEDFFSNYSKSIEFDPKGN